MDRHVQQPQANDGFPNHDLFADSNYNGFDTLFPNDHNQTYDASWGVNASNYPAASRAQHASTPSWQQNANQLSAQSANQNAQSPSDQYGRSLSHSPAPFTQATFNGYGNQQRYQHQQQSFAFDPALVAPSTSAQNYNTGYSTYGTSTGNAGTIAPQALEHEVREPVQNGSTQDAMDLTYSGADNKRNPTSQRAQIVDQATLAAAIPKSNEAGIYSIINFDALVRATNSERMGNFVNIGRESHEWSLNISTLPKYVARRSRNELRRIAGGDSALLSKIGKKAVKKEKTVKIKDLSTGLLKAPGGYLKAPTAQSPTDKIKYEQDSSSEEESSSEEDDDDSEYESDSGEPSPLPAKRPDSPKSAVEYDTIKALWRGKKYGMDATDRRKGLVDFWEVVKTIRDRWKADSEAVKVAEDKKRIGELPLLKSRVKDQRDMAESAFKTALKYGHRSIIELFSQNLPFLFACYQLLLDRHKEDDLNSPLSRAILEVLSLTEGLTEDTVEKTHLVKVLPRYVKKGDAKTQYYAKRVVANAAAGTKQKAQVPSTDKSIVTKLQGGQVASPTGKRASPEPVAGIKRPAGNTAAGNVQKKVAVGGLKASAPPSAGAKPGEAPLKRPVSSVNASKNAAPTVSGGIAAAKPKQVVTKPSGFFSSLQSAAKKPGTSLSAKSGQPASVFSASKPAEKKAAGVAPSIPASKPAFSFAETMANLTKPKEKEPTPKPEEILPPETPEQKAKRLRKEERRKLRVTFKEPDALEEIHYFVHEVEEEQGHDASMVRDVADVGGEGRMLKQHMEMMDIDDDEDDAQVLLEWTAPSVIDFTPIEVEERKRNYAPYGGGEMKPECPERAAREQYEANTLMVYYTDPSDIPPSPKEPADPYNGESTGPTKQFGAVPEKVVAKLAKKTTQQNQYQPQQQFSAPHPAPAPAPDLSAIMSMIKPQQQQPQQQQIDLEKIFASFANSSGVHPAPNAPIANTMPPPTQPPPANGAFDLAALLARVGPPQPGAAQAPQMGGFGQANMAPNMTGYQPQQQNNNRQGRNGNFANLYRTKICKYWQEGRCVRGDECTYLHENR